MSRVHRRGVIAGPRGGGAKTYAQFQAQIATLATGGALAWSALAQTAGSYRVTAAAATGTMFASSWNDAYFFQSTAARVIQHALTSEAVFNDQVSNGWEIFVVVTNTTTGINFVGSNRNGYMSSSFNDGNPYARRTVTDLIRWDGSQAWRSNPSIGGAETLYTW